MAMTIGAQEITQQVAHETIVRILGDSSLRAQVFLRVELAFSNESKLTTTTTVDRERHQLLQRPLSSLTLHERRCTIYGTPSNFGALCLAKMTNKLKKVPYRQCVKPIL